jgi:hypothetical protein
MIERLELSGAGRSPDAAPPADGPSDAAFNGQANGRAEGGRFAKGNSYGKGNAFNRRLAAQRQAMLDAITPDEWAKLFRRTYDQALGGDVAAQKLLYSYYVGKPAEVINPDTLEADELRQLLEAPAVLDVVRGGGRVSPALAVQILAETLAVDADSYRREWAATVAKLRAELDELKEQRARLQGHLDDDDLLDDDDDLDGGGDDPNPPRGAA